MIQLMSLAPAPIRAFADIETLGPICVIVQHKHQKNPKIIESKKGKPNILQFSRYTKYEQGYMAFKCQKISFLKRLDRLPVIQPGCIMEM